MSEFDDKVKRAIKAYKAKKRSEARELLMEVVDLDEKHEQGWLYLSLVVDSKQEQQICLENVLAINPNNQQARQALEVLNKKLGAPPPPPPPTTPSTAPPQISGFGSIQETEEDDGTINSWGDIDTSTASFSGFDEPSTSSSAFGAASAASTAPTPSPEPTSSPGDAAGWFNDMDSPWQTDANDPATSGSLDFSDMAASSAATSPPETTYSYGRAGLDSGGEFSSNELDSWISEMGIGSGGDDETGGAATPANDPFGSADSGGVSSSAFEGTDFDWGAAAKSDDDDGMRFGGWDDDFSTPASSASPASGSDVGSAFDSLGAGWDQIDTSSSSAFASTFSSTPNPAPEPVKEPEPAVASASTSLLGSDDDDDDDAGSIFPTYGDDSGLSLFDDDDDDDNDMASILGESRDLSDIDGLDSSGEVRVDALLLEYAAQIPAEIQAIQGASTASKREKSGGIGMGVVLLTLLNIGLAAAAFVQFSNM